MTGPTEVHFCTGCTKPMQAQRPNGTVFQEGWYYWDGNIYCTVCWQAIWAALKSPI